MAPNFDFEEPSDDFEADYTEEDTKVPDHPVVVPVDGYGQASAYLAKYSLIEDARKEAEKNGDAAGGFGADKVAEILRTHYVSPSFEGLTGEKVGDMRLSSPDAHLNAIMPGMDASMNQDGSADIEQGN